MTRKFDDRFVIPLVGLEPYASGLFTSIKPGTYQEVKAAVIEDKHLNRVRRDQAYRRDEFGDEDDGW